jgi:serine/threonine-protein kinase RsbW
VITGHAGDRPGIVRAMAAEPIPPEGAALRIDASVERCADVRRFVRHAGAQAGLSGQALDDLVCATDEAVTNAILHGYRRASGWLDVRVSSTPDTVSVAVRDAAPPFDPTGIPTPDLETPFERRRPGGMGVHLMRQLTDELRYRSTPDGGNELTLVKRRTAQEEERTHGHAH